MAKILVVDDSEDLLEMITLLLKINGHAVATSYNVPGTVKTIRTFSPDLIIIDALLGSRSGRELCKQVRMYHPKMPIILMSASPEQLKSYKDCKADAVIEKPFDVLMMNNTIDALLAIA